MRNVEVSLFIAVVGGCAIAVQGQFMGITDRSIGTSGSIFVNYITGAVIAGLIILMLQGGSLKDLAQIPWYTFSIGILGLIVAGSISYTVPRLGLSTAFTVIIASQFIVVLILEHFGWFGETSIPIDFSRLVGVVGLIFSVWLITKS